MQHAHQTILPDIPGTTDIAVNMLIFAENTKQHDKTLTQVVEQSKPKDITLNFTKILRILQKQFKVLWFYV